MTPHNAVAPQHGAPTEGFEIWTAYFQANLARHDRLDALIPWESPCTLSDADAAALARSLQRFQLGESGDGTGLLSKAWRREDADYDRALRLFVAEEQKHSALFGGALARFGVERLSEHWSDGAFVLLRRMMGLRTEVTLFLVVETVAMEYFTALGRCADPVVRGVARRILTDEVEHVRFQIDQLRTSFDGVPRPARVVAAAAAWILAVGTATALAIDHGRAMRSCGLGPVTFWHRALRHFGRALPLAFRLGDEAAAFGPSVQPDADRLGRVGRVPARR
jgi:hypothetical protein